MNAPKSFNRAKLFGRRWCHSRRPSIQLLWSEAYFTVGNACICVLYILMADGFFECLGGFFAKGFVALNFFEQLFGLA